jgi:hypothetical protein
MYFVAKTIITALLISLISFLSKKYSLLGSALAALPLVSVLSMIWMKVEGSSKEVISGFSRDVFYMVLPSLPMFLIFPWLYEQRGLNFWMSLILCCFITSALYALMVKWFFN